MVHPDADCHGISENFIRGYCKENGNFSNTVSEVVEEVTKSQQITKNLDEIVHSRPFYYGYNTENVKQRIGIESKTDPLRLAFTSIILLVFTFRRLIFNNLVWHIECTYKLNNKRFPLMSMRVSGLSGN